MIRECSKSERKSIQREKDAYFSRVDKKHGFLGLQNVVDSKDRNKVESAPWWNTKEKEKLKGRK